MTEVSPSLVSRVQQARAQRDGVSDSWALEAFVSYCESLGIQLYPAQEEAILELFSDHHVLLKTPTGSGKSLVALALHFFALCRNERSVYTAPTKALVNEKFFALCEALGPNEVGLLTGDAAVNPDADVICCTAEVLANRALREDDLDIGYVVMDEFHYFGDKSRGMAWQIPLITMQDTVFLLMSATLGNTSLIEKKLSDFTDRPVVAVTNVERPVPLSFAYREEDLHDAISSLVDQGLTPVYLVNFTQRDCAEQAQNLMSINVSSKEEKRRIAEELATVRCDTPYGKEFLRFVRHGIGIHHAGLLPKYRRIVERLAQEGLMKVISGTDTLGVGVNIPIRTVVLRQLYKYNGEKTTIVSAREFHQIAGRAGRKGFDDEGLVVVLAPPWVVENKKRERKAISHPHLAKKLRKVSPPPRSLPWDAATMERLCRAEPEPLTPQFAVTHGMIINLLQSAPPTIAGGYGRLLDLIYRSYGTDKDKSYQRKRAAQFMRELRAAGIVALEPRPDRPGKHFVVRGDLQRDFSLHHSLSLYLVETIDLVPQGDTWACDVLSLVEAILEDPTPVLLRQRDTLRDRLMADLKAAGVPYEERIERLEEVDWPKPNEAFIRETFAAYCAVHPWVRQEDIHPKSVAREIYEQCADFSFYVRQYGLGRVEGVLLRYLSSVYKTAVQTVPQDRWTPEFEDILATLYTLVRQVDASLLEEWSLLTQGPVLSVAAGEQPQRPPSLVDDPRALVARVRAEIHTFLGAVAKRDFEAAVSHLHATDAIAWTPEEIAAAFAPLWDAGKDIDTTPAARRPQWTTMRKEGPGRFVVLHSVCDTEGESDFGIEFVVDFATISDEDQPLITPRRFGV